MSKDKERSIDENAAGDDLNAPTATVNYSPTEHALQAIADAVENNSTELALYDCGLTALPPEVGQLKNLKELDLSNNSLNELPPELAQLTSLESLDLSGNCLTALPPELGQLKTLSFFTLKITS